ncbi:uncharacterized protein [Macrobrachium rosenbergii]|uniref:uncharacterized protein n=1 Tax=Macrobrachium rosenbergii TaxID=79674 RepID=UPI0034D74DBC
MRTLNIPKHALHSLLEISTKKAPFSNHRGHMFTQIENVAMGSPPGVLFANFYMGTVEQRVFKNSIQPRMYVRQIDDTFIIGDLREEIEDLRHAFHQPSSLTFTTEHSKYRRLPFLDVLVEEKEAHSSIKVYNKQMNLGMCLNGERECPERYKHSIINAYVRRALSHCSSWNDTHDELERVAQVLVDNGHPNKEIGESIRRNVENWYQQELCPNVPEHIDLFYRGFFHKKYKDDECALQKIIEENDNTTNLEKKVNSVIYYKNRKTSSLMMKNNPVVPQQDPLKKTNVIYCYLCPTRGCLSSYIGMTMMLFSKRVSCHAQEGAIFNHAKTAHNQRIK